MTRFVVALVGLTLLGATRSQAGVPDPVQNLVPDHIVVVGRLDAGARPDPVGTATIVVRDFANNPLVGAIVTLDFSSCCDIALCDAVANQQATGVAGSKVSGLTDQNGRVDFIVMGAARDPGTSTPPAQYPGCGKNGVIVRANSGTGELVIGTSTAVALDLNGVAGMSNGTTISDVANLVNLFGSIILGDPFRGRGDISKDGNLTLQDVGALLAHAGRLNLSGGVGCTAPYAPGAGCP